MLRPHSRRALLASIAALLTVCVVACGSTAGGINIDEFKDPTDASTAPGEYVIGIGDVLSVQVFNEPQASGRVRVRSDGRISLAFVNEVEAVGKTPLQLAREIEGGLKNVIVSPQVTIVVEESTPLSISVIGEVSRPGPQALQHDTGVADALAAAGGLSTFAHKDRIFVVRSRPQPVRIHFTYDALIKGIGRAPLFRLRAGDVVVVE